MSTIKWTEEQMQAIIEKDKNILVSAAAGSGKTAVLVERMINKIINDNIDIDKILIVTFTNAAASEMKERILEAIYDRLEKDENNVHLQKQIVLLNKANISTIHAFCLNVIKNNFFEIGISADFRIGQTAEIELLKAETLEDLLEELYEKEDEKIVKISEIYSGYKGDENLKSLILNIYNYIQSTPFPIDWLNEQTEKFNITNINQDFSLTEWGQILLTNYKENILNNISELELFKNKIQNDIDLQKYYNVLCDDIEQLQALISEPFNWNNAYQLSKDFKLKTWPSDKKIVAEIKDTIKDKRAEVRANIKKIVDKTFLYLSEFANMDIKSMYEILVLLKEVIVLFSIKFSENKQAKNILDFNDIEHYALKILTKKDEFGNVIPSDIAESYKIKFEEIAIDEYQDSNLVQEYILNTISNNKNLFMVGDVKQSIYKFRQARPELFLQKYDDYKLKEQYQENDSLKIQLFNNFRSRESILKFANSIFANIMTRDLGDVDYNESEYLNYKADYKKEVTDENIEIHIIDNTNEEYTEDEENEEVIEQLEKTTLEAKFVANRIKKLIDSNYLVWDKKEGYRKVKYKDIVILFRSPNAVSSIYEREISELGIPVFSDTNVKYLDSIEIETIMNLLRIIDNPLQDIPLVTVLRSYIGGFTDNELVEIRLVDKKCNYFETLLKAKSSVNKELQVKIENFLQKLEGWQLEQEYLSLDEFIWKIYIDTGYYNYVSLMPNGEFRQANLKMLFEQAKQYEEASFKGLFNFIKFIERLKRNNGDLASAKLIGENEDVVRIMSIHKSKGLEFPVVFLSATGKSFNLQDLKEDILLHQDLGFGPKYINYEKRISYDTLAKEALKIKVKNETVSEEMRLLYVALTRSKEKLIITGVIRNASKKTQQKEDIINNITEINYLLVKRYNNYLDWIELVCLKESQNLKDILSISYYKKQALEKEFSKVINIEEKEGILNLLSKYKTNKADYNIIDFKLGWKYANIENTKLEGKTSVSNIVKNSKIDIKYNKPKFIKDKSSLNPGEIGTLIHLVLQNINMYEEYDVELLENELMKLINKGIITEIESKYIDKTQILKFLNSELANRIKKSNKLVKEQPFYKYVKASEIFETNSEEPILIQGIIDLYFIEDNEIVLVDYKTDRVKEEAELINKHSKQLLLYKKALEEATGIRVKQVYIYSTALNKSIEI